jgi:hypothetical protein
MHSEDREGDIELLREALYCVTVHYDLSIVCKFSLMVD